VRAIAARDAGRPLETPKRLPYLSFTSAALRRHNFRLKLALTDPEC
jgi:hypothetical protein